MVSGVRVGGRVLSTHSQSKIVYGHTCVCVCVCVCVCACVSCCMYLHNILNIFKNVFNIRR